MVHTCRIPGCAAFTRSAIKGTAQGTAASVHFKHFNLRNPKFCKTEKDRIWAESLKRFMLSYCDPKKSLILRLYHVERVTICERHFAPEDMISKTGKNGQVIKKLKYGAIPTLNLPKKGGQLLPDPYAKHPEREKKRRKPPKERQFTPAIKTFPNLCSAAKRMAANGKSNWNISVAEMVVKAVKPDPDGFDQNQYTITIQDGFKIGISYYSWCLPEDHNLLSYDLSVDSLSSFLKHVESMKVCKGALLPIGLGDATLIKHTVTKTGGNGCTEPLISKSLGLRPKQCSIFLSGEEEHCAVCVKKNKALATLIAKKQAKESKTYSIKRLSDFKPSNFWELEAKRLRLAEKTAKKPERSTTPPPAVPEQSPEYPFMDYDTVPKELWITPAMKQAHDLPELQKSLFVNFWKSQMEKLYAPNNNARHYPKELMEFWSDVWQLGKQAYKRLVKSGLLGIPSPSTMKVYVKKKMKNLDNSISGVVASTCTAERASGNLKPSEHGENISLSADKEQDNSTEAAAATCSDVIVDTVNGTELSSVTSCEENARDPSEQSNSGTMDLLIFDHETGTTKNITLPVTVLRDSEVLPQTTGHSDESVAGDQDPTMTASSVTSGCGPATTATAPPALKQATNTKAKIAASGDKSIVENGPHEKVGATGGGKEEAHVPTCDNKQKSFKFTLEENSASSTGPCLTLTNLLPGMVFRLLPTTQDLNHSNSNQPRLDNTETGTGSTSSVQCDNLSLGGEDLQKSVHSSVKNQPVAVEFNSVDTAMEFSFECDDSVL